MGHKQNRIMKKSQKLMLLHIADAYNKAQENNYTIPFYSENPGIAGFRYLGLGIDPYAAFSPTLFDKVEEIDEDELHEDIAKHIGDKSFPENYTCYELTDKRGNISQVVVDDFYLPNSYDICDFIIDNDDHKDLKREEITEGANGYPRNLHACITGFSTFDDAKTFADTYGLELQTIRRRDGHDLWESCNSYGPLKTQDYLADRYYVSNTYPGILFDIDNQIAEYADMVEDDPSLADTVAQLNALRAKVEKMLHDNPLADDEIIYYNSEDPEEDPTITKAEVTSIHDDDVHTYAIAAVPLV